MKNSISGLKNRIQKVCRRWYGQARYFSFSIAVADFITTTVLRSSSSKLKHNISKYYYDKAECIVMRRYGYVLDRWKNKAVTENLVEENAPVFIFWWQGYESAPRIIKECIKTIKMHVRNHKIIFIDKNTWRNYVDIPGYIIEMVEGGSINVTLFSDILRCFLLYEHGGIWIDPTCYVTEDLSKDIYQHPFYSICHGDDWEHPVCMGKWATFFLCCGKANPLIGFARDMFLEYWKYEKAFVVYLSTDLFLKIAYENLDYARREIDDVPVNNRERENLIKALKQNGGKNFELLINKVDSGTYIHKLTYKTYIEKFDRE